MTRRPPAQKISAVRKPSAARKAPPLRFPEPDPEGPEEHKDIEWDDDFVPWQPGRVFRWDLIADQLRQRPGKWARVTGATGYLTLVTAVKQGTGPVALRDGFQAASRRGEIWMRYVGHR